MKELLSHISTIGKELDSNLIYQILLIAIFFGIEIGEVKEVEILGSTIDTDTIRLLAPFVFFILLSRYAINTLAFINTAEQIDNFNYAENKELWIYRPRCIHLPLLLMDHNESEIKSTINPVLVFVIYMIAGINMGIAAYSITKVPWKPVGFIYILLYGIILYELVLQVRKRKDSKRHRATGFSILVFCLISFLVLQFVVSKI